MNVIKCGKCGGNAVRTSTGYVCHAKQVVGKKPNETVVECGWTAPIPA